MAKFRPWHECFVAPGVFVYMYHGLLWQRVVCTCGVPAACVAFGLFGAACGRRVDCTAACVAMTRVLRCHGPRRLHLRTSLGLRPIRNTVELELIAIPRWPLANHGFLFRRRRVAGLLPASCQRARISICTFSGHHIVSMLS